MNPNDKCSCGSGKKFKKCCQFKGMTAEFGTDHKEVVLDTRGPFQLPLVTFKLDQSRSNTSRNYGRLLQINSDGRPSEEGRRRVKGPSRDLLTKSTLINPS
jgi:hypothetical protein